MRRFCSESNPVDWKQIRLEAITMLGSQINFKEEEYAEVPVIEGMMRHLMSKYAQKKMIPKDFVHTLLDASITLHKQLPNIIEVNRLLVELPEPDESAEGPSLEYGSRLSIVGDLHGQYDDLAMLFDEPLLADYPSPYNQFVFNGDMVNRGPMSAETIVTILFCNLLLPNAVHVLRGNHETKMCIHQFGFKAEILRKYDVEILNKFTTLFDALPVGAVVDNDYFVVHGGLGNVSGESTIEELNQLNRLEELREESVLMELLWSGMFVVLMFVEIFLCVVGAWLVIYSRKDIALYTMRLTTYITVKETTYTTSILTCYLCIRPARQHFRARKERRTRRFRHYVRPGHYGSFSRTKRSTGL